MVTPSLYNLCMSSPAASLRYRFLGLDFASPIVLLSGCVGFGEEYTRIEGFSNADCGGIVLKGTTLEPRLGNRPHRVYETPMGMLNAIGLQNMMPQERQQATHAYIPHAAASAFAHFFKSL